MVRAEATMSEPLRAWSPVWGMGSLDYQVRKTVFTPDSGVSPVTIAWVESRTGQANVKSEPRKKADRDEWWEWLTLTTKTGDVFSFRRNGPPHGAGS